MGQNVGAWCGEGLTVVNSDAPGFGRGVAHSRSAGGDWAEVERLVEGCPRELADALRETGQWDALRCRPWLSSGAFRGLQRSLQRCQLLKLEDRHREASVPEECSYSLPVNVAWADLDVDHVISSGQVFKRETAAGEKVWQMRRVGLTAVKQGKVGIVLLAGGTNLRLGCGEPPAGCMNRLLELCSGKSIIQLCCERLRRVIQLCRTLEDFKASPATSRVSVPVFIMTSRLTHRRVVEHLEANRYFGLSQRDVFFFDQSVEPVLSEDGHLLPQSLGGEFAHAPGGTGQVLRALAGSSALEQMRDRGVECLHIVGTENVLARVCDPVFVGFCRDLEVDCAAKIVERLEPLEEIELFCVKSSPVTTQLADIEEAACGVTPNEAPEEALKLRSSSGGLCYCGAINSVFMSVQYIEDVVGRPVRAHRQKRVVPYLDFYLDKEGESAAFGMEEQLPAVGSATDANLSSAKKPMTGPAVSVLPGSWPAETSSPELACQRALLAAAAEIRVACKPGPLDREEAWRCDVHLDPTGPLAVVRVRAAHRAPFLLPESLNTPGVYSAATSSRASPPPLMCSLIVPSKPNAYVLETSILDYFAYTDRAVAFEVERKSEYASVSEGQGRFSAEAARNALYQLHQGWAVSVGAKFSDESPEPSIEISPLLSYEGEGLSIGGILSATLRPPCHLPGPDESRADEDCPDVGDETNMDGLDTRLFYFQEYPRRPEMSQSVAPQFRKKLPDPALPSQSNGKGNSAASSGRSSPANAVAGVGGGVGGMLSRPGSIDSDSGAPRSWPAPLSAPSSGLAGVSDLRPKGVKAEAMPAAAPPYQAGAIELPSGMGMPSTGVGNLPATASNSAFWERR